jgi:hypothetical protein
VKADVEQGNRLSTSCAACTLPLFSRPCRLPGWVSVKPLLSDEQSAKGWKQGCHFFLEGAGMEENELRLYGIGQNLRQSFLNKQRKKETNKKATYSLEKHNLLCLFPGCRVVRHRGPLSRTSPKFCPQMETKRGLRVRVTGREDYKTTWFYEKLLIFFVLKSIVHSLEEHRTRSSRLRVNY